MKVYLSGRILGLTYDEANNWRAEVADGFEAVGIGTINPLRRRVFFTAGDEDYTPNEIVTRDVQDVRDADLILVYLPYSTEFSTGTICEIWEAYRQGKPIVLVSDDERLTKHPWLLVAVTRMFPDFKSAVKYIVTRWADLDEEMLPPIWV